MAEEKQHQVRARSGQTEEGKPVYGRVVFEGNEYDAKRYVEMSYPRPHVEPGTYYGDAGPQPDVILVMPDGAEHVYHADPQLGWNPRDGKQEESQDSAPEPQKSSRTPKTP